MTIRRQAPIVYVLWSVLIALGVATGAAVHRLWEFRSQLERLADQLTLDAGPESTLLYDANNNLVSALFEEHRIAVPLDQISPHLVNAVLVTEDKRFYDHDGIDIRRVVMAFIANRRAGDIVQGGSTITQQLVRSILLSREKSYVRKIKEAILARRLEERYPKRAILEAYLNRVYFGDGYYGLQAASLGYFGKTASELDAVESAMLAGLIKGPSLYSPTRAPELARKRRDLVLALMRDEGVLSPEDYRTAVALPVKATLAKADRTTDLRRMRGAEYFRDAVAKELIKRFGSEAVYTGGLRVYTTLDRRMQALAEETIASRLSRMPRGREPLQGALVAIDPRTGHVKAIVGGRSFDESPFNRATEAKRQPGSAFKPFIFAMALESGYAPSTQLDGLDQPIQTAQGPWLPRGEHETSSVRLRDALVVSSNRAAAHLLQEVGVSRTLDLVQRFGVSSQMPNVPSLALGTGELTVLELTSAYGVFANRGVWREPTMIRVVVDRYGREIYRAPETERQVISEATAFLMTSMMADVVDRGTASTARSAGFRLAAAGKTGTSQSYADAWFVGYTPQLVTGVWIGYDKPQTIMDRGFASVVAVPVWARFMSAALRGASNAWFDMPGSLMKVKLCRLSGLLATDRCHLPVVESAAFDPNNPDVPAAPNTREGRVYDELRHVSRLPQTCPLPHGEGLPHDGTHPTDAAAAMDAGAEETGADIVRREMPAVARAPRPTPRQPALPDFSSIRRPASLTEPSTDGVAPVPEPEEGPIPGSRIDRRIEAPPSATPPAPPAAPPGVLPGSSISTTPPRPPGNGSPDSPDGTPRFH
jgi:1A family penicillin-binding protein